MPKCFIDKYTMAIIIRKTGGPWPANRYGIVLKNLPRFLRKFLINHRNLAKWSDDDQFMECVLKCRGQNLQLPPRFIGMWLMIEL